MEPVVTKGATSEVKYGITDYVARCDYMLLGLCPGNVDCPGEGGTPIRITCRIFVRNNASNIIIATSNVRVLLMSNSFNSFYRKMNCRQKRSGYCEKIRHGGKTGGAVAILLPKDEPSQVPSGMRCGESPTKDSEDEENLKHGRGDTTESG
jgi:hypothetical protein